MFYEQLLLVSGCLESIQFLIHLYCCNRMIAAAVLHLHNLWDGMPRHWTPDASQLPPQADRGEPQRWQVS